MGGKQMRSSMYAIYSNRHVEYSKLSNWIAPYKELPRVLRIQTVCQTLAVL